MFLFIAWSTVVSTYAHILSAKGRIFETWVATLNAQNQLATFVMHFIHGKIYVRTKPEEFMHGKISGEKALL